MTDNKEIAAIRRNYSLKALTEEEVSRNPFMQFTAWWKEAVDSEILDVNAMALATADSEGCPSVRIVLLKGMSEEGYTFFTNYESRKSAEMEANPQAAVLFFWKELERQVRITGRVVKTSREESEEYFKSRPVESRLGAWASRQSAEIPDRKYLETKFAEAENMFREGEVELPEYWGGWRLVPEYYEFWQGRDSRLHDRIAYKCDGEGGWRVVRLSP